MNDLYFFYSAKIAVVFILMLSSPTLEAQQNENEKFYDLMTAIGEHFGGKFNDAKKALELDLNAANSFLEGLHTFATREIVKKLENGKFECKVSKKIDFKMAINSILGQNAQNLLKAIIVPKRYDSVQFSGDQLYKIKTIFDLKTNEKAEDLLKDFSEFSEEKLFNLLFSFATRLEAFVHGKNSDGTLKEKQENSKDKIQTFLAVPNCFPERETNVFGYWIEIIVMETEQSQKPIFGVGIYKEKYGKYKNERSKKQAVALSHRIYKILKQLNYQKFSIYESLNLLRHIFNCAYVYRSEKHISRGELSDIFTNLSSLINYAVDFEWEIRLNWENTKKYECKYAMIFQNISESLMKMMSDKMIDPKLHLDSQDIKIHEYVQKDVEQNCKTFDNNDNVEEKILYLNNVHYELAINFEFNQLKDVHERASDLLSDWVRNLKHWAFQTPYLKMLRKLKNFTLNTNIKEKISIIEALIGKEHVDQFNLGSLFDQIKTLVEVTISAEETKLLNAIEQINTKQLENDIEFLKNNPKSIDEQRYQNAVAIICTIKLHGEKVEMLKLDMKVYQNFINQDKLNYSLLKIQQYREHFGPDLWEQTDEFCNQLKPKQIKKEEKSFPKQLDALKFEIDEISKSFEEGLKGIEEYYLNIPLMQLKDQAQTLAKTFRKMLENVTEHYAQKMYESNVGTE